MKTGLHVDTVYLKHHAPQGHPERAERIENLMLYKELQNLNGLARLGAARKATAEEISLIHTPGHLARVAKTAGHRATALDLDTYASADSYDTALFAAGGVLDLIDRVVGGELDNGIALVRPPGHHAEADRAMGFCLFNNVAIGARYLLERHGVKRVLIVDWDVHHGNGTQKSFYTENRVLFVSLHQYPFYPGTGALNEVGEGGAEGFTVNIPFPGGFGDEEYLLAFREIVEPVADQFQPEFVLISAGFDAHHADPLGGMRVTEHGFAEMASVILRISSTHARNRCVAVLEGGYDLAGLAASVLAVVERLRIGPGAPTSVPRGAPVWLERIRQAHRTHWRL